MKVNGQCVSCVRNSSYSFMPIHLKLYMCYGHGPKICMWFFSQFELSHFFVHFCEWIEGTLCAQLLLQFYTDTFETVRNSSYSFILILLKLYRCCDHALKICMWLGYTPQINFCHFFYNLKLVIFWTFLHLESDCLPVGGIVFHKHIF